MNHKTHLYLMVGVVPVAALLLITGYGGSWVLFALLGGCAAMMFFMMRGLGGDQDHGGMDSGDTPGEPKKKPFSQRKR